MPTYLNVWLSIFYQKKIIRGHTFTVRYRTLFVR